MIGGEKMQIDLTKIPTPELIEIRNILMHGVRGYASKENAELKRLKYENAQLKKVDHRRSVLAEIGVDIDEDSDYWLSLDDATFDFVVGKMVDIQKELALAEKTQSIRVPALISQHELNTLDTVREGLTNLKNRRNGDGS
jgi:hypothetical protein